MTKDLNEQFQAAKKKYIALSQTNAAGLSFEEREKLRKACREARDEYFKLYGKIHFDL